MDYFDLHCDTISECYKHHMQLYNNPLQLSLKKGRSFQRWVQTYAIWIDDVLEGEEAYRHFNEVYTYFLNQLELNKEHLVWCSDQDGLRNYTRPHQCVALLAVEGSRALGNDISRVKEFYDKGVRLMTLTWNGRSPVGDGCMVESPIGLTTFGEQVILKMQEVGIIIDVSHLCEKGFWQVENLTTQPFVATHSNSRTICNVPRNLTDEQFRVFVERKGLVGMNFYPLFINGTVRASIQELLPHIDHFLQLGGEDVISMGSDFDGAKMPVDLPNLSSIQYLGKLLIKRYGKEKAEKFMFENAYHFFTHPIK